MTCTINKKKIWALLLAVVMMISVFSICAYAADGTETEPLLTGGLLTGANDGEDGAENDAGTTTEAPTETTTTTAAGSETTTTSASETTTTTAASGEEEDKSWVEEHMSFIIATGVIIALFIIYFALRLFIPKFKAKTDKFWKDYNAEFKKLIWPTKSQLVKNSTVVLVTVVIFAVVLALLDYGLTKGIYALKDLVDLIRPAS